MVRKTAAALTAIAGAIAMAGATAQTVQDTQTPSNGLNIPDGVTVFGTNPDIRKPTAVVNDTVITGTDVDQRVQLILGLRDLKVSEEEKAQLRLQVLRAIIDETLQIQEAAVNEITITKAEIDQGFNRVASNFQRTPEQLKTYLDEVGASERTLRRQIEGELAWRRLLSRQVTPFINVGEEEVQAVLARLEAAKGTDEYHLKEIYISATPDRAAEVTAAMQKMLEQLRGGAPFEYLASTYSEASTKAVGGDLDWVRLPMLPAPLQQAAQEMNVGQIAGPIEVPGGYSMLYLVDKRQVLTADPRDARLSLRQISLGFPDGTTQEQASARAAAFAKATQAIRGCGEVTKAAAELNAEVVDNDSIRIRELPPQLQEIVLKLQIGQATPPFGSAADGIRSLVLCGRDEATGGGLPSAQQIQSGLEEQRVNLRAQRMLRDLRRDAVVEYR
ncbi:peptidylprolyl isomerase [Sphingomonas japonica]|nr:peptidylprolyl isomerase [Sphingomonas japonica]